MTEDRELTVVTGVSRGIGFELARQLAGASAISTASVRGYQPTPHLLDFAVIKSAIISFAHNLVRMLAERGIRVIVVAPVPVWTPLNPATMPDPTCFGEQSPLGRSAQPAEPAPAYVLLASGQVTSITGEIVHATGGTPLP
ncbi:SDR family oxidoreductase [Streptomyces sp. NPDC096079]|uniref:SDR family oxidoreductase n=1 Tax=Streptomyces sp. NPDC096079 TaxID=3155820 RepID=UPI00331C9123